MVSTLVWSIVTLYHSTTKGKATEKLNSIHYCVKPRMDGCTEDMASVTCTVVEVRDVTSERHRLSYNTYLVIKVARWGFSGAITTRFDYQLRRYWQRFITAQIKMLTLGRCCSWKTVSGHLKSYTHIPAVPPLKVSPRNPVIWRASFLFFFVIGMRKSFRMKCIRFYRGNISLVEDFNCKGATKPRQKERVCNVHPCPIWYVFQSPQLAFVFTTFIILSFIHVLKNRD